MPDTTAPPPAPHQRLTALVHGFVQNVGYRDFCRRQAYRLSPTDLSGYARNLSSGSTVEVVAEGPRQLLDSLLQQLHQGPGMARVSSIDATWSTATHEFDRFTTRY
ncbi:MAG: acylphosphatase [Chloroflexi bacterium]|nr:MAG: acylphosphatase [Chloroflexota bacterium]